MPNSRLVCASFIFHTAYAYTHTLTRGRIPSSLGLLSNISVVLLFQNHLTGPLPEAMNRSNVPLLSAFSAEDNQLTGTIPPMFGSTKLFYLWLSGNNVEGPIPEEMGEMTNLQYLYLDNNQLTGTIPSSFAKLTELRYLAVDRNYNPHSERTLYGSLDLFENITHLTYFTASQNSFSGSIPHTLSGLKYLKTLDLSENAFIGSIPQTYFGQMVSLGSLFLQSNQFVGPVPIPRSINLTVFDVSMNTFTGTVPTELFALPSISILSLSANCLEIKLSTSICQSTTIEELFMSGLGRNNGCPSSNPFVTPPVVPSCLWTMRSLKKLYISGVDDNIMVTIAYYMFLSCFTHLIPTSASTIFLRAQLYNRRISLY